MGWLLWTCLEGCSAYHLPRPHVPQQVATTPMSSTTGNKIGNEGCNDIAECLKFNSTLTSVDLYCMAVDVP